MPKDVVIPEKINGVTVTVIGSEAFTSCSNLNSITIPNGVTEIGYRAFLDCGGLKKIQVEKGNKVFDSRGNSNAIINTKSNSLIWGCENTIIPDNVTSICDFAFDSCSGMTSITIPDSVTSISDCAFSNCSEFEIHGKKGSYAQKYAKEYKIPFVEE